VPLYLNMQLLQLQLADSYFDPSASASSSFILSGPRFFIEDCECSASTVRIFAMFSKCFQCCPQFYQYVSLSLSDHPPC